jgi:hypothetical protein
MPIDDDKFNKVISEIAELKSLLVTKKGESMIDILEAIRDMLYTNPFISNDLGVIGDDSEEEGDGDESDGDFEIKEIEEK